MSAVASVTGISRQTLYSARQELSFVTKPVAGERIRREGGGRKSLVERQPTLLRDLESLVEPSSCGDPESVLRWTCKSTSKLTRELEGMGYTISQRSVASLLQEMGYSLQGLRKTREGSEHPDRDAQFRHIASLVQEFQQQGKPVISVDTKKKELIGEYDNKVGLHLTVGTQNDLSQSKLVTEIPQFEP